MRRISRCLFAVVAAVPLSGCVMPFPGYDGGSRDWASDELPDYASLVEGAPACKAWRLVCEGEWNVQGGPQDLSGLTFCGSPEKCIGVGDSNGVLGRYLFRCERGLTDVWHLRNVAEKTLAGRTDLEAVAFDPLRHTVYVADEADGSVREYDPDTGRELQRLPDPFPPNQLRGNGGLESLAVSGDGLRMWAASETPLLADGDVSNAGTGGVVRIVLFGRGHGFDAWKKKGEWLYQCDPVAGKSFRGVATSGVSELVELPDRTLLVLEREMSRTPMPRFRTRIYRVRPLGAKRVSEHGGPLEKQLLFEASPRRSNYEGMALAEADGKGRRLLVLTADGDGACAATFMVLGLLER